jgi:hypothetical protein
MFCEAIVTMKSGTAIDIIASSVNMGALHSTLGHWNVDAPAPPCQRMAATATTTAAGTA